MLRLCVLLFYSSVMTVLNVQAQTEPRVALVIGNGNYAETGWRLDNPPSDAELIAETLRDLDFDVILETDLGEEDLPMVRFKCIIMWYLNTKNTREKCI